MNPLVKKEILLMLPAWLAVLVLEGALPWLFHDFAGAFQLLPLFFFLGVIIPAVSSFGREFNAGSFQLLMSQPVERERIWRTKLAVLIYAIGSILFVHFASCWLRLYLAYSGAHSGVYGTALTGPDILRTMSASGIGALIALASGLWTTLLFRQVATAFWITLLIPASLATLIGLFLPTNASSTTFLVVFEMAAGLYVVVAFWLARRLFYRAQDVGWTGGNVSLSRWRYFEASSTSAGIIRKHRPILALVRKEFQLHSTTLFGAAVMLGLQIIFFLLRICLYTYSNNNSAAVIFSDFFWLLWLVFPLIIGCTVIAEERRLGMSAQQFCLPVSRRLQFIIKFLPALILGIFLGGIVPLLLETIVTHFGAPTEVFLQAVPGILRFFGLAYTLLALSIGLTVAAIFGSSLTRTFLQALSIALLAIICIPVLLTVIELINGLSSIDSDVPFIPTPWFVIIALPAIPLALTWLAYLNFNCFQDNRWLWRHNVSVLLGMIVAICFLSHAIYYRPWEMLTPIKSPSGPARLSSQSPVKLSITGNIISVVLPDGRLWMEYHNYSYVSSKLPGLLKTTLSTQSGFVAGSNWIETASDNYQTAGIRSDGTLWNVQGWGLSGLTENGTDTNWSRIASGFDNLLVIKTDGSLWGSGYGFKDYQLDPTKLHRIGSEIHWVNVFSGRDPSAEKNDGSIWSLQTERGQNAINAQLVQTMIWSPGIIFGGFWAVEINTNGRLWLLTEPATNGQWHIDGLPAYSKKVQLGQDAKWKSVSWGWGEIIGLRSDGTLWKWPHPVWPNFNFENNRPIQIGNYSNWIALSSNYDGIALAADGSLWAWGEQSDYSWLAPSRQPVFLGNIFSTNSIN